MIPLLVSNDEGAGKTLQFVCKACTPGTYHSSASYKGSKKRAGRR